MKLTIAAALICAAGTANALSCIPPDPAASFQRAAESEDSYAVLLGTFRFDPITLPGMEETNDPTYQPPSAMARFSGQGLAANGFGRTADRDVVIQPLCFGPWCGNMAPDLPTLAFVKVGPDGGYTVEVDPCGGWVFPDPGPEMIRAVEACMRGETCEPDFNPRRR